MQISFILVEPAVPENVGSAARAMKTMGFSDLVLINPCNHLSDPARWLAHASNDILENARVFDKLEDALEDVDFSVATTAKKRSVKFDYHSLPELPGLLIAKGQSVEKMAIVFGREESGLRNSELKICDIVTTVPLKTTYPSLNLAQAVMLYAYELSKIELQISRPLSGANRESFRALQLKIKQVLSEAGFKEDTNIYPRFFERINYLGEDDINLLHSFCNKFLKKEK